MDRTDLSAGVAPNTPKGIVVLDEFPRNGICTAVKSHPRQSFSGRFAAQQSIKEKD